MPACRGRHVHPDGTEQKKTKREHGQMDFTIPKDIQDYLTILDAFIEGEIKPL